MSAHHVSGRGKAQKMLSNLSTKLNSSLFNKPHQSLTFEQKWRRINVTLAPLGRISRGNTITVYRDSGDAFRSMWGSVDSASSSVKWQTYICKDDTVGKITMAKLQAAHERGVTTELLYDCGGNISGRARLTSKLRELGATVIRHRPFFHHMWTYFKSGGLWELSPGIRNHRKILIVDQRIAYTGGLNIGDDYCGTACGGNGRFRDTQCMIMGPAVAHLNEVYEDTKHPLTWPLRFARWRQVISSRRLQRQSALLDRVRKFRSLRYGTDRAASSPVASAGAGGPSDDAGVAAVTARQSARGLSPRVIYQMRLFRKAAGDRASSKMKSVMEHAKSAGDDRRSALLRQCSSAVTWSRQALDAKRMMKPQRSPGSIGVPDSEAIPEAIELFCKQAQGNETNSGILHDRECTTTFGPAELQASPSLNVTAQSSDTSFVQILMSNPHTKDWSIQLAMWQITRFVHRRLWITTPYYMPYRKLTSAIIQSAQRGVDIRIIAGSHRTTDPWFMWYASRYLTRRLLKAGVRVYEFDGGQIMHAKTVVADSVWSSVGSYNWDMMSNKNMEVCATAFDIGAARQLEEQFLLDLAQAKEVTLEDLDREWWWCWRAVSFAFYQALRFLEYFTFRTYRDCELDSQID
jgi:cardiolipin synthase